MGPVNVTVMEVGETTIKIDANHPLAGKKLIFDLEVVGID
jgi:FKBP-type peptidyl-prolyl cis-trans isomerase 2